MPKINYPKYQWGVLDEVRPGFWLKTDRWPWDKRSLAMLSSPEEARREKYGWIPSKGGTGRFGGGWNWKLGVAIASSGLYFDLLFGTLSFGWRTKKSADSENMWALERYEKQKGKPDASMTALIRESYANR